VGRLQELKQWNIMFTIMFTDTWCGGPERVVYTLLSTTVGQFSDE